MPSGWPFILCAVFLRLTEGVGSSLTFTAVYTFIPEFSPNRVGMITVCQSHFSCNYERAVYIIIIQGIFEVGTGLGFVIGPALGGFLYSVSIS